MQKHILPADDPKVEDLIADITEALAEALQDQADVSESSETGEPVIELWKGELGGTRRFRLQLVEVTD